MKHLTIINTLLLMGCAGNALADCPAGYNDAVINLNDTQVHASGGGELWDEAHCGSGGSLYKIGVAGSTVDGPTQVCTYSYSSVEGITTVTYNYTGGSSYSFTLKKNGTTNDYCWDNGGTAIIGTLTSSAVVC